MVGVDPSLTSTGVAILDTEDVLVIETFTVASKGRRDDSWPDRWRRIDDAAGRVVQLVPAGAAVAIEAPSYGQARQSGVHDRAGLWWAIYSRIIDAGAPVSPVPPATRARYAAGKGNAAKDAVLAAAVRRYPQAAIANNDEADAVVLAAWLARHLGHPIEDHMPATHLSASKTKK